VDVLAPLLGGTMIGLATAVLLVGEGRVCGVSGILGELVERADGPQAWRVAFLAGLVTGGALLQQVLPASLGLPVTTGPLAVLAGVLVGFGTRMSGGCTSGHGVCGNARLSPRSIVATLTFMLVAMGVTFVLRHALA
jgi:uncharacterized membrane protein YedE/YeeE